MSDTMRVHVFKINTNLKMNTMNEGKHKGISI